MEDFVCLKATDGKTVFFFLNTMPLKRCPKIEENSIADNIVIYSLEGLLKGEINISQENEKNTNKYKNDKWLQARPVGLLRRVFWVRRLSVMDASCLSLENMALDTEDLITSK